MEFFGPHWQWSRCVHSSDKRVEWSQCNLRPLYSAYQPWVPQNELRKLNSKTRILDLHFFEGVQSMFALSLRDSRPQRVPVLSAHYVPPPSPPLHSCTYTYPRTYVRTGAPGEARQQQQSHVEQPRTERSRSDELLRITRWSDEDYSPAFAPLLDHVHELPTPDCLGILCPEHFTQSKCGVMLAASRYVFPAVCTYAFPAATLRYVNE